MTSCIKATDNGIVFGNRHFSVTLDKTCKVIEIINLDTNENVIDTESDRDFVYLKAHDKSKIPPVSVKADGDILKVSFENGLEADIKIEAFDGFITLELVSELDASVWAIYFGNLYTTLKEIKDEDSYMLNSVGMTAWTNPQVVGYREPAPESSAYACTVYDKSAKGAKLALVFSKKRDAIPYLKSVADAIDSRVGLTSKAGGAYARDWDANYGDYAIVTNLEPSFLEENLKLAAEFKIDQYDVHQMAGKTFVQGNFEFNFTENGTAEEFKNGAGKKIREAGLISAMHTYAYYISPSAHSILADPKWQKQLKTKDCYTLAEDIEKDALTLPTVEDASGFEVAMAFLHTNMNYALLDEEIIKIDEARADGLYKCERGCCGTKAVAHKKGAVLKHLDGVFRMFTPVLGSELFYHIADNTAKAYNEGGFDMLYFDAIDGIGRHIDKTKHEPWYYHQMFIHRVLSQCERTPLVETSSSSPSEWNFRGRCGAWDYANLSIKKHIANHVRKNLQSIKTNMTATLGWFNFFTDEHIWGHMKNNNYKTLFHDDMDFLGMNALLYDMSLVYHPLDSKSILENPFHYSNIKYYTEHYTKLRRSHYFKPEVLEKVKNSGGEWRVIKRGEDFLFQQIAYEKANLGNLWRLGDNTLSGKNPFKKQMPFIRIEARYSTLFEEPEVFARIDDSKPVGDVKLDTPTEFPNIDSRIAQTVKVKGTGRDGDAALISISGGVQGELGGRIDHFIDLNFEGWREFLFIDMDNADYDLDKYQFEGISTDYSSYDTYRFCPYFTTLKNVAIRVCGETGKNAAFGDIVSYPQTEAPIKNPSVTVNGETVTFNCELHGGDYIEYDPETDKALLFHNTEQTVEEIAMTGRLAVDGEYTATYSAECLTEAPLRAKLVLGFIGDEAGNKKA